MCVWCVWRVFACAPRASWCVCGGGVQNVFHTAFNDTHKPLYLADNADGQPRLAPRRTAVLAAATSGVPVSSARVLGGTASGPRTGYSLDIFIPMYNASLLGNVRTPSGGGTSESFETLYLCLDRIP
jgi:hypothetical protein